METMTALIRIAGDDAVDFLQGQLTQDVARLDTTDNLPAAWCSPKGRVFVTARLQRMDDGIGLAVPPAEVGADLAHHPVVDRDIGSEAFLATTVDDRSPTNHEILHAGLG